MLLGPLLLSGLLMAQPPAVVSITAVGTPITSLRLMAGLPTDPHQIACTIVPKAATATAPHQANVICSVSVAGVAKRVYQATVYQLSAAIAGSASFMQGESLVMFSITGSTWCARVEAVSSDTSGLHKTALSGNF